MGRQEMGENPFEKWDFSTKNGKPPGSDGRPSKEFLEAKKAWDAVNSLEQLAPGLIADLIERGIGNGSKRGDGGLNSDVQRLKELFEAPLKGFILQFGALAGGLMGLYALESYGKFPIPDREGKINWYKVPPILHTIMDILVNLLPLIEKSVGVLSINKTTGDWIKNGYQSTKDTISGWF